MEDSKKQGMRENKLRQSLKTSENERQAGLKLMREKAKY